jgi:hypothetical protein
VGLPGQGLEDLQGAEDVHDGEGAREHEAEALRAVFGLVSVAWAVLVVSGLESGGGPEVSEGHTIITALLP